MHSSIPLFGPTRSPFLPSSASDFLPGFEPSLLTFTPYDRPFSSPFTTRPMTGAHQHPRTSASRKLLAAALLALPALVVAQDGGVSGATSSSA